MDDLLPTVLLVFFVGIFVYTWLDWKVRERRFGGIAEPSWECPGCGVVNEADRGVCWSCNAAISGRSLFSELGATARDTWRCRRCGAWNGTARKSCWSCANAPTKRPKGLA
ncbi:MAG TPA: hypothetical protein VIB49_10930 [Thermoplasmata archaeon]